MGARRQHLVAVGMRFGKWIVLSQSTNRGNRHHWFCRCDCGTERSVCGKNMATGISTNCGCVRKQSLPASRKKHGESQSSLYKRWKAMVQRCTKSSDRNFPNYGGRGIRVCREWLQFEPFRDWALQHGYDGSLTLDRIDNNQGYAPENCRWVSQIDNCNNKRGNLWIEAFGERKTLSEWSRDPRCKTSQSNLCRRIHLGVPPDMAISAKQYTLGRLRS